MASLGQAWAQGQRNAQEAAMNQVSTIMNLAKTAKEADQFAEYFSPVEKESRARASDTKKAKLEALKDIDKISKEFYSNPRSAAQKMLKQQYGEDFDILGTPDGLLAINPNTGQVLELGKSNEQMLDGLIKNRYFSSEEKAANVISKSDAQIASAIKQKEMDSKNQSFARWINDPDNITDLRKSGISANASMYGSKLGAMSAIEQANIGMGLKGLDATKFAADTAARELGMTWDDTNKDYVGTVNINGSPTQMLLKDMPSEAKTKFATVYKGALSGFANPIDSTGKQTNPFLASQAAAYASRKALEQAGLPAQQGGRGAPAAPVDPYSQWRQSSQIPASGGISYDPGAVQAPAVGLPQRPIYDTATPRQ